MNLTTVVTVIDSQICNIIRITSRGLKMICLTSSFQLLKKNWLESSLLDELESVESVARYWTQGKHTGWRKKKCLGTHTKMNGEKRENYWQVCLEGSVAIIRVLWHLPSLLSPSLCKQTSLGANPPPCMRKLCRIRQFRFCRKWKLYRKYILPLKKWGHVKVMGRRWRTKDERW